MKHIKSKLIKLRLFRRAARLCTAVVCVLAVALLPAGTAYAANEGYWQLVSVINLEISKNLLEAYNAECSYGQGSFHYSQCSSLYDGGSLITTYDITFTEPPERIYAGEQVSISISVQTSEINNNLSPTDYSAFSGLPAWAGRTHIDFIEFEGAGIQIETLQRQMAHYFVTIRALVY